MPLENSSDDDLLTSSDEEIILNRRKTHEKIRGYVNNVALFQFFPRFALTLTDFDKLFSYASHVKNPNPLKARATTFYDPVHNALDKEAQCAWKEGQGSYWPSVYIQKPFMTL
jgi:hypothetical protein